MVVLTPGAQKVYDSLIEQGAEQKERLIVSNMLSNGLSCDEVSKFTGLSVNEINQLCGIK